MNRWFEKTPQPQLNKSLHAESLGIFRPYSIWVVIPGGLASGKPSEKIHCSLLA
jgi:hypothetical protein